ITAPADQEEGTEMVVAGWLKDVGDQVAENEPLLEISTDKVTVEIASPAAGILREIVKSAEQPVGAGEVLGRIERGESRAEAAAAGAPRSAAPSAPGASAASAAELTPAVRRLLAEHGLQASAISGTGRDGRITVQDVEAHLAARKGAPGKADSPSVAAGASAIPSRRVPHTGMRRSIAQHMVQSVATAPHVTAVFEADLSAILAHREANRAALEADGVKLTYTAYFVAASVAALQAVPEVNSRWHDDALELFEDCNIGVATALPQGGLILPVILRAQTLDLKAIAERLQDLTNRARTGALTPKDVQHGTFSISNHGVSGSLVAAPIVIPQPQSAILGVGKLQRRTVVRERGGKDAVEVRPMCYVTLTIDHRVLDGYQANAFLTRWVEVIEGWA
ncbi:MAG TPA: 2-oxo acid dehydrogenase subunit E2, partial [Gemmatimonadales bacterium]|nr:2-oxo acid dehydrogenase subunit E2 [Gemmatimonadales bacterium]